MNNFLVRAALIILPFFIAWFAIASLSCDLVSSKPALSNSVVQRRAAWLWRVGLSFGVGITLSTLVLWFFLQWPRVSSLHDTLSRAFFAEIVLAFCAFIFWYRKRRNARHRVLEPSQNESTHLNELKYQRKLWCAWCLCAFFSATVFATATWSRYYGELDAWGSWNMHARFFSRGGVRWADYFNPILDWSHPDYPLLTSLSVARGWAIAGFEWNGIPILLNLLFALATVVVLMSSLCSMRGKNQALLAGIVLLGTPFFALHNASQTADIPLSFALLCSFVCLFGFQNSTEERAKYSFATLSGFFAGSAAWTKNEGSAWFLCLGAVFFFRLFLEKRHLQSSNKDSSPLHAVLSWKCKVVSTSLFVLAALPGLFAKISMGFFASSGDLVAAQGATTWEKISNLSRWTETFWSFILTSQTFGLWACPSAIFLWYYARAVGIKSSFFGRELWPSRALLLMAASYFAVFIVTPHPLEWHLTNSLNRLFLQLWPCAVFVFFIAVRTPEEAIRGFKQTSQTSSV